METNIEFVKQTVDEINDILEEDDVCEKLNSIAKKLNIDIEINEDMTEEDLKIFFHLIEEILSKNKESKEYLYANIESGVLCIFSDDELKIKRINEIEDESDKSEVIESLSSDEKKIEFLGQIEDKWKKADIIKSLTSDEKKIEFLGQIEDKWKKADIIKSLTSDEKKIEFLGQIEDKWKKADIIKSLSSDEKKIEFLGQIEDKRKKADIIKSLSSDEKKIECLGQFEDEGYKSDIILSLTSDEKKIECLGQIEDKWKKADIIKSLTSDEKKIECLGQIEDKRKKADIIKSLSSDEKKIECLGQIEDKWKKADIILSLTSYEKKIEFLGQIEDKGYKSVILKSLGSDEKKIECLGQIEDEGHKSDIIRSLTSDEKKIECLGQIEDEGHKSDIIRSLTSDEKKIECLGQIEDEGHKSNIILSLTNDEKKIEFLMGITDLAVIRNFRRSNETTIEFIKENLEFFLQKECRNDNNDYMKNLVSKMYETNNDIVRTLDFEMLDKKYVNTLGVEKINLIGCFPELQEKIINLPNEQYELFSGCLNHYIENHNTEEWTPLVNILLDNISGYEELSNDILNKMKNNKKENKNATEGIDFEKIITILQDNNDFAISSLSDVENYDSIVESKISELIKSNNIDDKRNAVFRKVFGHNLTYAEKIIDLYAEGIEQIENSDIKNYIEVLKLIMNCETADLLDKVYQCNNIQKCQMNKILIERQIKNEYGKLFNEGLFKIDEDTPKIEGQENVYDAGTDFRMIITAIGAYSNDHDLSNYQKDWNRPALDSQHFCASYIRNDMIGTATIDSICYGFVDMNDDALMLSAPYDLSSSYTGFESKSAENEKYYAPEEQINNTEYHNEMDFRRVQGGHKKQPDYIVIFSDEQLEEAQKASKDFGGLPIVRVNVEACLEAESKKVDDMMKQYEEQGRPEKLYKQIKQKIHNNRVTTRNRNFGYKENFRDDIDIEAIKPNPQIEQEKNVEKTENQSKKERVTLEDLKENNEQVNAQERKKEVSKISNILNKVNKIIKGDILNGHETK